MRPNNMLNQEYLAWESLSALRAGIRRRQRQQCAVTQQGTVVRGRGGRRPLPQAGEAAVFDHLNLLDEPFAAVGALEGPLARVNPNVVS